MPNYRRLYVPGGTVSRRKQRESDVWQRRFLEHTIKDEQDRFRWAVPTLRDYNAVKHRYVTCPRVAVFKLRKVDCSGGIHAEMGVRVRRCDMAAARLESDRGVRWGVRRSPWAVPTLLTCGRPNK